MKICTRYLDFIEKHDCACDSPAWSDILAHAGNCPDCASAMKMRAEMLEQLEQMHRVSLPPDLHQRIMNEIDSQDSVRSDSEPWYETLIDRILRPAEIGFSLACVMMIALMVSSEFEDRNQQPSLRSAPVQIAELNANPSGKVQSNHDELDPVSSEEVQQFLARLDRFNRRHSNMQQPVDKSYMPELQLVNDWK